MYRMYRAVLTARYRTVLTARYMRYRMLYGTVRTVRMAYGTVREPRVIVHPNTLSQLRVVTRSPVDFPSLT